MWHSRNPILWFTFSSAIYFEMLFYEGCKLCVWINILYQDTLLFHFSLLEFAVNQVNFLKNPMYWLHLQGFSLNSSLALASLYSFISIPPSWLLAVLSQVSCYSCLFSRSWLLKWALEKVQYLHDNFDNLTRASLSW